MGRPALTPAAREEQMIAMAYDTAERQLREGTASSQVITHFLKLASSRERIEKEILEKQKDLIEAKTKAYQANELAEKRFEEAMRAFSRYQGNFSGSEVVEDEDDPNIF